MAPHSDVMTDVYAFYLILDKTRAMHVLKKRAELCISRLLHDLNMSHAHLHLLIYLCQMLIYVNVPCLIQLCLAKPSKYFPYLYTLPLSNFAGTYIWDIDYHVIQLEPTKWMNSRRPSQIMVVMSLGYGAHQLLE
jgi:uncharacterized membrane protein